MTLPKEATAEKERKLLQVALNNERTFAIAATALKIPHPTGRLLM